MLGDPSLPFRIVCSWASFLWAKNLRGSIPALLLTLLRSPTSKELLFFCGVLFGGGAYPPSTPLGHQRQDSLKGVQTGPR